MYHDSQTVSSMIAENGTTNISPYKPVRISSRNLIPVNINVEELTNSKLFGLNTSSTTQKKRGKKQEKINQNNNNHNHNHHKKQEKINQNQQQSSTTTRKNKLNLKQQSTTRKNKPNLKQQSPVKPEKKTTVKTKSTTITSKKQNTKK